jgi:hypothetical protein
MLKFSILTFGDAQHDQQSNVIAALRTQPE